MSKRPRDQSFPRPKGTGKKMKTTTPIRKRAVANKETGYVDTASAAYALDTTGAIALISTIAQGTSVNQRVGKKVLLKSLQIRGAAQQGSTATLNDCAVLIVYDKRPTGSLPAVTAILDTANSNSFNNDSNSGRFKIVRRWDFCLSGNSATPATGNEIKDMSQYIPLNGLPLVFKAATTGVIGDIEEGALYVVTVGATGAGTAAASAQLGFRLRFVDN